MSEKTKRGDGINVELHKKLILMLLSLIVGLVFGFGIGFSIAASPAAKFEAVNYTDSEPKAIAYFATGLVVEYSVKGMLPETFALFATLEGAKMHFDGKELTMRKGDNVCLPVNVIPMHKQGLASPDAVHPEMGCFTIEDAQI